MKTSWNYRNFVSKKVVFLTGFLVIILCCITKLFTGSVSINGDRIYNYMIADYWNFGKELLGGKILYTDLVDHKGWYLYLIYKRMVFFSRNNICIVPVLEAILYIATIYLFYRHVSLSSQSKQSSIFPTALFSVVYLIVTYRVTMINTEGFILPLFLYIWDEIRYKKQINYEFFFFVGVLLGVLFNFKPTAVVPFLPIFVYALAYYCKNKKNIVSFFKFTLCGIVVFFITNVPFLIYLINHKCANDFLEINQFVLQKSDKLELQMIVISIFVLLLVAYCVKKNKEDLSAFFVSLCAVMMAFQFGDNFNYYIALYVTLMLTEAFQKEKANLAILLLTTILFYRDVVITIKVTDVYPVGTQTRYISEKYGINNSNVLYLEEDYGYGVYGEELFKEPLQWCPSMMMYSSDFTEYYSELTIQRLEEQRFEYVSFLTETQIQAALDLLCEKDTLPLSKEKIQMLIFYNNVIPALLENYECVGEIGHLYRVKTSE